MSIYNQIHHQMKTDYKKTFIYGLIEKGTQEVKYVGNGSIHYLPAIHAINRYLVLL